MAEENEVNFKITDRRKFNPDGTLRDTVAETTEAAPEQTANNQEAAKVVSFPTEAARKPEPPPQQQAESAHPPGSGMGQRPRPSPQQQGPRAAPRQSEAAFFNLVNMIAVEAAVSLGLVEHPARGGISIDIETARHMVDMLGALEERTRGNLSAREQKMIEELLSDLRMQYVAASRR